MKPNQMDVLARKMREEHLLQNVRDRARTLGLLECHHRDSRAASPGFPDLVLVGRRVAFRELKREHGRLTTPQRRWISWLQQAGADAEVWRPSDLLNGRVDAELQQIQRGAASANS